MEGTKKIRTLNIFRNLQLISSIFRIIDLFSNKIGDPNFSADQRNHSQDSHNEKAKKLTFKENVVEPNNSAQAKSQLSHVSFKIRDRKNRSRKKDGYSYNMSKTE